MRAAATARREGWERERRAKMHHVRSASRGCRFYCVYCTWGMISLIAQLVEKSSGKESSESILGSVIFF